MGWGNNQCLLRFVTPQNCVGVYIVRVFRLDGDPSLVSLVQVIILRSSRAMDGCSMLGGYIGSRQATNVNMPPLIYSGWSLRKYHNFEVF